MRWNIMNTKVHQNPRIWGSYEAEVENVRSFIRKRVAWMDKRLGYTFVPRSIDSPHINFAQPYQVYNLAGMPCGSSIEKVPAGVYIVRQGQVAKVVRR